ncbi:peptidase inhibitor family I36 protein [Actinokineospora sp. NBRC 105648]|uniref:peptidase inhibitor family I36 protein n=1 Tax=Actinokineospora sp. NBRC 105648 TaxID=3032206 RepID=UPI002557A6FB|nr:peptidase inhibitor family I36 protein [Actinokineospora sp. NBRC 105648]
MVLTSAAMLTSAALPAAADPPPDCPDGNYCFWSQGSYQGKTKARTLPANTCFTPEVTWPDGTSSRIGSVYNNRTERSQLEAFDNPDCAGASYARVRYQQGSPQVSGRVKSLRIAPRCDVDRVCVYENADFTGAMWQVGVPYTNRCFHAEGMRGKAYYNATGYAATFFRSTLCTILPYSPVAPWSYGSLDEAVQLVKID